MGLTGLRTRRRARCLATFAGVVALVTATVGTASAATGGFAAQASTAFTFPSAAVRGATVLVVARGLRGSISAVTVCSVPARILGAFGPTALFVVPANAPAGSCRVVAVGSRGGTASAAFTVETAPTAVVSIPPSVDVGSPATLTGSGSFDPDGDSLTYAWALTAKPVASAATIANPTSADTTFSPDVAGSYTFCLTVTDSHGLLSVPVCASLRASGIPVP